MKYLNIIFGLFFLFAGTTAFPLESTDAITQARFAEYLVNSLGLTDMLPDNPATEDYFSILAARGITPPGGFEADKVLTNGDMAIILERSLGLEDAVIKKLTGEDDKGKFLAMLINIEGSVNVKKDSNGDWTPAQERMTLAEGASVSTEKTSSAILQIGSMGGIKILNDSEIIIKTLNYNPDKTENVLLYLARGDMIVDINDIKKGSAFKTATPISVAAIKGTTYKLSYNGQNMEVDVTSGAVTTYALDANGNRTGDPVTVNFSQFLSQSGNQPSGNTQSLSETLAGSINSQAGNLQNMIQSSLNITLSQAGSGLSPADAQAAIDAGAEIAVQAAIEALADAGVNVNGPINSFVTFGEALDILSQGINAQTLGAEGYQPPPGGNRFGPNAPGFAPENPASQS
ncbi:FecR domain-containing protein [bacterium]|jgi:hypothetical protein|nr:FecR domain-containing protein [bacterium]